MMFPFMDLISQYIMRTHELQQVASARFGIQSIFVIILLILLRKNIKSILFDNIKIKFLMGIILAMISTTFFLAIQYTTLSIAVSITFLSPIIIGVLSTIFLKQKPTIINIISIVIGFFAVLLIIRPDVDGINLGAVFAVATAFIWATMIILTQVYKDKIQSFDMLCTPAIICAIIHFIVFSFLYPDKNFISPEPYFWKLSSFTGALGILIWFCVFKGVKIIGANKSAPLQYLELASAMLLEFIIYTIVPDTKSLIGASLIVMAGLLIWYDDKNKKMS